MSYNNYDIKNFISKENSQMKKQLNEIWKQFMSSFGYQKFYNLKENNQKSRIENIYNSTSNILQNESCCVSSIKSLFLFFEQNSILISKNNHLLISNNKKGMLLLSEPKIWIMYIIFIDQKYDDSLNKILIIMNLFNEAIKNNCDIISLFEFFLIYISKLEYNDLCIIKSKKIIETLPKEFIFFYIKKKSILKNIFNKDNYNYNYIKISNNIGNTQSTIISTDINYNQPDFQNKDKDKNEEFKFDAENNILKNDNICLDINNIIIICKDYLNKGFFAIFKENKNLKGNNEEMINNPFVNKEFDEEDENYCLMPLLEKYNNYEEKMNANKILILINKSIYKNYTYYPYDINIINKL